jgi:hypothetical protein
MVTLTVLALAVMAEEWVLLVALADTMGMWVMAFRAVLSRVCCDH